MDIAPIEAFLRVTAAELMIKLAAALALWALGHWLIGRAVELTRAAMRRQDSDPAVARWVGTIVAVSLNVALVLGILGYFGLQTVSFAALLAGAGVAAGAACSGLLGHLAAGAFMRVLRPFKEGDLVCAGGVTGTVRELGLFGTTLVTADNVLTIVGNGKVFGGTIHNYSALPVRRVERVAQLAAGVDPAEAIARLKVAVEQIPHVAASPAAEVSLLDINLLGTVIAVRPYCHASHYWQVYFDTNEAIVRTCREAGWPAPTPASVTRIVSTPLHAAAPYVEDFAPVLAQQGLGPRVGRQPG